MKIQVLKKFRKICGTKVLKSNSSLGYRQEPIQQNSVKRIEKNEKWISGCWPFRVTCFIIVICAPDRGAQNTQQRRAQGSFSMLKNAFPRSQEAAFCEGSREAPGRLCKKLLLRSFWLRLVRDFFWSVFFSYFFKQLHPGLENIDAPT